MDHVIDQRDVGRQWSQIPPLFVESGAEAGAEFAFDLVIGDRVAPVPGLSVQVRTVGKGPCCEEIPFNEGEQALDMRLAVGDPLGMEMRRGPKCSPRAWISEAMAACGADVRRPALRSTCCRRLGSR